mgnify:CR=1 FL=1
MVVFELLLQHGFEGDPPVRTARNQQPTATETRSSKVELKTDSLAVGVGEGDPPVSSTANGLITAHHTLDLQLAVSGPDCGELRRTGRVQASPTAKTTTQLGLYEDRACNADLPYEGKLMHSAVRNGALKAIHHGEWPDC